MENNKPDFFETRNNMDPIIREKWNKEQKELSLKIKEYDDFDWSLSNLKYIGGMDLSFFKNVKNVACSYFVILSYPDLKLIYEDYEFVELDVPYIPGFLAYREAPHLIALYNKLKQKKPELLPQIILFDGNGILHCNGCGLASHMGVLLDLPTIGVSKTMFYVDGMTADRIYNTADRTLKKKGENFKIIGKSKRVWGAAYKSGKYEDDLLIISIGHKISLQTAISIVDKCCLGYSPEPVYLADKRSRDLIWKTEKNRSRILTVKNNL